MHKPARIADTRAGEDWVVACHLEQRVAVGEVGQRGDADDAGGQAVQAVDEVDRVDGDDHDQDGENQALVRGQDDHVAVGARDPGQLDTAPDQDAARGHLAGQLADGAHAPAVVDGAHHDHEAAGQQQADGGARADQHLAQIAEPVGHQEGSAQATEHGQATEPGRGRQVHVAVARFVHDVEDDGERAGPAESAGRSPPRR